MSLPFQDNMLNLPHNQVMTLEQLNHFRKKLLIPGPVSEKIVLPGRDKMNLFFVVFFIFRKEILRFFCDIVQMFHQFKIKVEHRNNLLLNKAMGKQTLI